MLRYASRPARHRHAQVDLVKEGEVKALKGGGDRDSAYLAFYRYIEGPRR